MDLVILESKELMQLQTKRSSIHAYISMAYCEFSTLDVKPDEIVLKQHLLELCSVQKKLIGHYLALDGYSNGPEMEIKIFERCGEMVKKMLESPKMTGLQSESKTKDIDETINLLQDLTPRFKSFQEIKPMKDLMDSETLGRICYEVALTIIFSKDEKVHNKMLNKAICLVPLTLYFLWTDLNSNKEEQTLESFFLFIKNRLKAMRRRKDLFSIGT